jgi:hypothetical protein
MILLFHFIEDDTMLSSDGESKNPLSKVQSSYSENEFPDHS